MDVPTSTLSNRLKQLEPTGTVSREVEDDSPPSVRYSLTEKGERLVALIEEIDAVA